MHMCSLKGRWGGGGPWRCLEIIDRILSWTAGRISYLFFTEAETLQGKKDHIADIVKQLLVSTTMESLNSDRLLLS